MLKAKELTAPGIFVKIECGLFDERPLTKMDAGLGESKKALQSVWSQLQDKLPSFGSKSIRKYK